MLVLYFMLIFSLNSYDTPVRHVLPFSPHMWGELGNFAQSATEVKTGFDTGSVQFRAYALTSTLHLTCSP